MVNLCPQKLFRLTQMEKWRRGVLRFGSILKTWFGCLSIASAIKQRPIQNKSVAVVFVLEPVRLCTRPGWSADCSPLAQGCHG